VVVLLGLALIVVLIVNARATAPAAETRIDALAASSNECVTCHRRSTPGIVEQYGHSSMAAAEVTCQDCHEVDASYPQAVEHEGTYVLNSPTPARCEPCHGAEVRQFYQSRHSLPSYVAYAGPEALNAAQLAQYHAIPEAGEGPVAQRSVLYDLEAHELTKFACETCHNVGLPREDGSVGQCQKCHLRHEFSLEQVRKPETCNNCHIGPDHPQWEIYEESPHGIAYATSGETWNWGKDPGTLTVNDFPAATCAICHFSGFGAAPTTHDVGERLSWYLFAPISDRRPAYQDNAARMQGVCLQCHNKNFIGDFYTAADAAVVRTNDYVKESNDIIQPLKDANLMTAEPFDQPVDFVSFELWHHWGRTAKFGVWMQGPDYTQWHGAYEILSDLADLREITENALNAVQPEASGRVTP
jgi:hypothetical protein